MDFPSDDGEFVCENSIRSLGLGSQDMRVLVADQFEQSGREGLAAMGCEVIYQPKLKDRPLLEALEKLRPDILIVRSARVTEAMLDIQPLKLVVRAGAGYNTIDISAASKRGVYVSNCPGKNSIAVAELAFGLILALDRRIADNVIFEGAQAAIARIHLERVPSAGMLEELQKANRDILDLNIISL